MMAFKDGIIALHYVVLAKRIKLTYSSFAFWAAEEDAIIECELANQEYVQLYEKLLKKHSTMEERVEIQMILVKRIKDVELCSNREQGLTESKQDRIFNKTVLVQILYLTARNSLVCFVLQNLYTIDY